MYYKLRRSVCLPDSTWVVKGHPIKINPKHLYETYFGYRVYHIDVNKFESTNELFNKSFVTLLESDLGIYDFQEFFDDL